MALTLTDRGEKLHSETYAIFSFFYSDLCYYEFSAHPPAKDFSNAEKLISYFEPILLR